MSWRSVITAAAVCFLAMQAAALDISNRYRSPRNPERRIRASTSLIILHTTEAAARGSLIKVSERGECHFCVTEDGTIYRIVDRDRVAFHAGRSMWNGKEDVDEYAIGIECVGYHDKPMGLAQLRAIAALVKELQEMYKIPDHGVIAHSHVAYGAPNKWQKKKHRGRKRCGMLFATATIRRILNLKAKPASDADVRAGRLVVGDPYLEKVLYRGIDTMARFYPTEPTRVAKPQPSISAKPKPKTTSKSPPKPSSPTAPKMPPPKSIAELKARGYKLRGSISPGNTAAKIAGAKWKSSETYYTIRNKVIPGNQIDPARIEKGMAVWFK